MNILYVSHEQSLHGASLCLLDTIDYMVKKGHKIHVLMHGNGGCFHKELASREVNIIPFIIDPWVFSRSRWQSRIKLLLKRPLSLLHLLNVIPKIRNLKIELMHSNTSFINLGGYLKKYLKIPHIWHFREFLEEGLDLHFFDKNRSLEFVNRYSDGIVFVSKAVYNKYLPFFDEKKMYLVYDGLPDKYLQIKNTCKKEKLTILISGYLAFGKGQLDAIKAIGHLKKQGFCDIFLLIAGHGSASYEKLLRETVTDLNLSEQVKFLGWQAEMNSLRRISDLELICSRFEGFGRTTIEAMMSMNPVIGSNSGANCELILDGINGFLYKSGDFIDLASKILFFLKNPEELQRFGKNGFEWSRNFSLDRNLAAIEKVYFEVTSRLPRKHYYEAK